MTTAKCVLLAAGLFVATSAVADPAPIVFVVRHAEKAPTGGNDPELSEAGLKRAQALDQMLKDAAITAIFTTEVKRTQQTAAPLAQTTQLTPIAIPGKEIAGLVEKLRGLKGNALVVGHSNTIPQLVKALGIETPVRIPDDDYTELFVITMGDQPQLLRLHY
ncbi:MAG: histidine phosphatase family protein [Chthoniobacterales bacterium]